MLVRRALLATALITATMLVTAGCSFTSPRASRNYYAPSDGAQADIGRLKARNLIALKDPAGNAGLVGAFVNSGSTDMTFALKYSLADGTDGYREFTVGAYKVLNFGYQNTKVLDIDLGGLPGESRSVIVFTEETEARISVPVMDATLAEYKKLVEALSKN